MNQSGGTGGNYEPEVRNFTIHAIEVDIVYNSFGAHQPEGAMFVLEENLEAAKKASGKVPSEDQSVDTSVIEPLVIRANVGDTVNIDFINHLDYHASIHQTDLPYDVKTSDGLSVGNNPDTTVSPGGKAEYQWQATSEGTHYFTDGVTQAWDSTPNGDPEEVNSRARGLFGAIVVEPKGATWTDPKTGKTLRSGTRADIHDPKERETDYREFVTFYHDPGAVYDKNGEQLTWPDGETPQSVHAINYRGDTTGLRVHDDPNCEDCDDEAAFYSSWVHGDPGGGDLVFETYSSDPVKFVAVGGNLEENHVHHLHNHRWNEIAERPDSDTIDSQSVAPGTTYETFLTAAHGDSIIDTVRPNMTFKEAFEAGMGGVHGGAGDILFHCHLFPHYAEGMAGLVRIHDKEQENLKRLSNNDPDIPKDSDELGFPEFIPGEDGEMPPEPPSPTNREPTEREEEALENIIPGAPYADPVTDSDAPVREYNIVALPTDIVYNDAGDHDPNGELFVLEEDAEAVRNGEMNPEPLFIRANVGDVVEITLRNETPDRAMSNHPHFVSFDALGSDSLTNGYNYEQGADPDGGELTYRWYADEEGTIFFHDHIEGIPYAMRGGFAGLIVEPEGSEWYDPHTGEPIRSGSQAIIKDPNGEDFREFGLLYHDFAQLKDQNGNFVTNQEEHNQNAGVMAINYRNAPYFRRNNDDPAYVHSSAVHGDPPTPVLESYPDDPVRVRLIMGPWEEQHNFAIHGLEHDSFGLDPRDSTAQAMGVSEAFTFRVTEDNDFEHASGPNGLPVRDYLYGSMIVDDLWTGMWGIHRVWGGEVDHLKPLPDREPPNQKIGNDELHNMGHPATRDNRAERGQKAKLLYDHNDDRRFPPDKDDRRNEHVGKKPQKAPQPGNPYSKKNRKHSSVRTYDVTAFQMDIPYNDYGDHDPHGIVFALDEHVEDIKSGNRPPEPLTIRANEGECVEVNLTNDLPRDLDNNHAHPEMRTERDWERSNRISLHPTNITYDVQGSDGATVGFNFDQTIPPGESITYRWYAGEQNDGCVLWDMADIRSNRHHGAFGQLIIEPEDSTWLDPKTAEPMVGGTEAMIKTEHGEDFREFPLAMSDGMYVVNPDGSPVVPPRPDPDEPVEEDAPPNQIGDHEDQGYVGINNRAEPFSRRFETNDAQHLVFDSDVHGDPNTPTLKALLDDPVTFQVNQTADKARGVAFHIANHQWQRFPGISESPQVGVTGDITPGKSHRIELLDGAGGDLGETGDFIYQEMKLRRRLEAGWWGLFRVGNTVDEFDELLQPLPDRAGGLSLDERPGWNVARGDVTGDGKEDVLIGVPHSDRTRVNAGAAYLFYGPVDESNITDLSTADAAFLGTEMGRHAGHNVRFEEDLIIVDDNKIRYIFIGTERPTGTMSLDDADIVVEPDW